MSSASAEQQPQQGTTGQARLPDDFSDLGSEILNLSNAQIAERARLIEGETRIFKSEYNRLQDEVSQMKEKINDTQKKISLNTTHPHLVSIVVEILDLERESNEDGGLIDKEAQMQDKCAVIRTTTRQTIFLPMIGLVDADDLAPNDLIAVNKDAFFIINKLPVEYDNRVKVMEVDEKPTETFTEIGGIDKQVEELVEAVCLPIEEADLFKKIGIKPPKGVIMYGPPGTGKTLLARACANHTNATFLKLAGPQLVQMFIGDGAKLVRDAFALAKEKAPTIIFIDEIDAVGTKRFDSDKSGDREVQRTMLELLNQLDGFGSNDNIKVIAATNRIDTLDPALLRSGRLDRKIEFPLPDEEGRARIIQIHSRLMNLAPDIDFRELARSCEEFNGAQCKAICTEAGMIAVRRGADVISQEDFREGIQEVEAKKKSTLSYFA
ncbi:26S proteasome regulatory subunit 6A [Mycoemilia scoparia]|uniref:26S proteasome regulatory subunit 6A n=1 Tax=Mycoemilia scoparia TaxID=417184 RepID=A0A9W8DJK4_9FUNG|nr:26S proteasome regulatory subunit 6A [Mycoemilia scoparia]